MEPNTNNPNPQPSNKAPQDADNLSPTANQEVKPDNALASNDAMPATETADAIKPSAQPDDTGLSPHTPAVTSPAASVSDESLKAMQGSAPVQSSGVPAFEPSASSSPTVTGGVVSGGDNSAGTVPPSPAGAFGGAVGGVGVVSTSKRPKKMLITAVAAVVLLGGGASAYYFGYKTNPTLIYSQSLSNTGKGYDKLIDYVDEQSKQKDRSYIGTGSYKIDTTSFATDGKLGYKGNSKEGEATFDIGLGTTRIEAEIRAVKSTGETPDLYLKVNGINGLGDLLGTPADMTAKLNQLNGAWIVVDHTLLDNATKAAGEEGELKQPTREEVMDEIRAFGKVNQDYVFSTAKDKAVTKVVKKHGIEQVDGHKAYHYTVALEKTNVKKYVIAQRDALKASKLGAWLKKNNYDAEIYRSFDEAAKSADKIKSDDTFDIWMDVDQRIIYKVRFADDKNAAENFVDVGLNYKGGGTYPFFISGQFDESGQDIKYSLVAALNTDTEATDFKFSLNVGGSGEGSVTANFNYKPSATAIKIEKPSGAKPLAQVFNELGYGELYKTYVDELSQLAQPPSSINPLYQ